MEYLRRLLRGARAVLTAMPPSQRYSVAVLLGVVAVSLVMLVTWGGQKSYVPALTNLTGEQMSGIQKALDASGMDYRFADATTLLVRQDERERALMILTENGALPTDISSSFGFEDLVKPQGFSLKTGQQQQMEFNIALGNMLARAISTAPEVSSAQVHIGSSRDGYFGPDRAEAGVNIIPKGSAKISEAKLAGICRLVASCVGPALPPEDVVVTNLVSGSAFSLRDGDSHFAEAASTMELQQSLNGYYAGEVEKFLAPFLGRVQTLVSVAVETSKTEMVEREFELVRRKTREASETEGQPAGGETLTTPNVGANVPTGTAATGGTSEESEKEEEKTPSKETVTATPAGEIKDVQISVLADLERVREAIRRKDALDADAQITKERLAQEYAHYEQILATGLPFTKGEAAAKVSLVSFSAEPYAQLQLFAAGGAPAVSGRLLDGFLGNWQRIAMGVLALAALFMIKSIAGRTADDEGALAAAEGQRIEEDVLLPEVEVDLDEKRAEKMRESIEDILQRDPQSAISLIRRWIARET